MARQKVRNMEYSTGYFYPRNLITSITIMKKGNLNEQFEDVASLFCVTSSHVKTILKVIHTVRSP